MVNLKINNRSVSVPEGTTVLTAASSIGIKIPHLCYLKEINEIAACRVCVVELVGKNRLVTACNTVVYEGMEILTNSPKVRRTRRTVVRLILSQHDCKCARCVRSGNCSLQTIANEMGYLGDPYEEDIEENDWDYNKTLIKEKSKCIKCMRCIQVCDKVQGLGVWDVVNTGKRTTVDVKDGKCIEESACVTCGQCVTHCPVGALRERDDVATVLKALNDPDKVTVVQVAPAVRTAWGERLGLSDEQATEKRLAAALRHMGFDYVFDTNFAADVTIMEEATEFIERFKAGELDKGPMFTSCCPAWVKFAKTQYPEILPQISTTKSPQQIFGTLTKTYFAEKMGIDPKNIYCVSIMPCLAKKNECEIDNINSSEAKKDVDIVLTTRELVRMIKTEAIIPEILEEEEFDSPLGSYTGAGVIFGTTGGVMEAALRTGYNMLTGQNPPLDVFDEIRGMKPWKEFSIDINGTTVKTAVVHGLKNTRELIKALKRGDVSYHFVEVMSCPGGCVGGGGQPIHDGVEMAEIRAPKLYELDENNPLRYSHMNPDVQAVYDSFLKTPCSEKAEKLLHTEHRV